MNRKLRAGERWLAVALFAALGAQLIYGLLSDGSTADELTYVAAGYRHWHGDFRVDPDHPPLAKLIAAAPLLLLHPEMTPVRPDDDQDGWAYRFFQQTNRSRPLLPAARAAIVLATLALALVVFTWARQAAGPGAGLLALAMTAFTPGFLAHGHLGTTDMLCTLFMVAASWRLWRFEQAPDGRRATLMALAVACALMTRLTTAVLLPALVLLALWRLRRNARALALLLLAHVVVIPIVLWGAYGFRYAPAPGDAGVPGGPWPKGGAGVLLRSASEHHLVPFAFGEGIRFQAHHEAGGHPSYLRGERSKTGWWYYYVVVLLVKVTPGALLLWAAAPFGRRGRDEAHWWVPAAVVFVAASAATVQLGERYILPVEAYLILGAAAACQKRGIAAVALAAHVVPALLAAPAGYVPYFNLVAGGAQGGHRWLADSNLDWGQDLPRLAAWMRAQNVTHVQLGYFGSDDPDRYGIAHDDLPTWPHSHRREYPPAMPLTGTVVLSPNLALGYLFPPTATPTRP